MFVTKVSSTSLLLESKTDLVCKWKTGKSYILKLSEVLSASVE